MSDPLLFQTADLSRPRHSAPSIVTCGKNFGFTVKNMTYIPTLTTERLRLRGHSLDDFSASFAMWQNPDVVRLISGRPSIEAEAWTRLLRYVGQWAILGYGYWVVEDIHTGQFLGEVGFGDFRRQITPALDCRPEAGWVLTRAAHGMGFGQEAVGAALGWLDAQRQFDQSYCIIAPTHIASIKLATTAGYVEAFTGKSMDAEVLVYERPSSKTSAP